MGFLDRLVGDMIRDSTGVDARRLLRKVGTKNILMAGAAAVAGGFAVDTINKRRQGMGSTGIPAAPGTPQPQGSFAPPPVPPRQAPQAGPPSPPATGLPPLPNLPPVPAPAAVPLVEPPEEDPSDSLPPSTLFAVVRTMVASALADGQLADSEREIILRRLQEAPLGQEQRQQIHQDLVIPASQPQLATMVGSPEERELLYRFARLVAAADGALQPTEEAWLASFAGALGLAADRVAALDRELAGTS